MSRGVDEYRLLLRRSRMMIEEAREALEKGRYDVAVFLAEQGLQLYLKAQLYRVLGDYPRTPSVRQLLALLARALGPGAESRVRRFSREKRPFLSELEDVYIAARYMLRVYTEEDARDIIGFVEEVIGFVEELLRGLGEDVGGEEKGASRVEEGG